MRALRWLRRLLALGLLGWLGLCAALYFAQDHLLFPAPPVARTPERGAVVRVPGGTAFLWLPPPTPDAPVVVHFHGNGGQIADELWLGDPVQAAGLGFAAVEYPGYAGVPGAPSETALIDAGRAALVYLQDTMGIPSARVALVGHSLGTGVALALAAEGRGARLLLLAPYTAITDAAAERYPYAPVRLLAKNPFDSLARAPRVTVPTLILHGEADQTIPIAQGRALAAALPHARFLAVDAGHQPWDAPAGREAALIFLSGDSAL